MLKLITGLYLLTATPASALTIAHFVGNATTVGTQPVSFHIIAGFRNYLPFANLPKISPSDLPHYSIELIGLDKSADPQTSIYTITGAVQYDGKTIQQLLPASASLGVDPMTGNAFLRVPLYFGRAMGPIDFRGANGDFLQGQFGLTGSTAAPFTGRLNVPHIDYVYEPGTFALLGLGALGFAQARRRR